MQIRQNDFFQKDREFKPNRISHGGTRANGLRKLSRPLAKNKSVHLILKSSEAKGQYSFLTAKNRLFIETTLRSRARQFGIALHSFENVGNHIHIVLKFKRREDFQNFLRTATALIARFVTGARRGKPFGRKFWDGLAFTRVINGYRDFLKILNYLKKNAIEREMGSDVRALIEALEDKRRKLWEEGVAQLKKTNGNHPILRFQVFG
jgi:REP element-mobilizing transposase RayT